MESAHPRQTVKAAVKQRPVTTRRGIMQRVFALWFDAFVYNQIWEDPRVDIKALKLDDTSRVLTISSGGCNALNYLLENPASVKAVDLNSNHIYFLNLKRAAIKHLMDHKEFFDLFGYGKSENAGEIYKRSIAQNLDKGARRFWEARTISGHLTGRSRIGYFEKGGIYEHSRNGYFLRAFHRFANLLGFKPDEVLKAQSREEQIRLYEEFTEPFFDSFLIRTVGKMPVTLFGLGIPPQQYEELKKDLDKDGTILDIYRARARKLAVGYPIDENYFAWQAFGRRYDTVNRKALPEYLKKVNFEPLKAGISKLETRVGSVTEEIRLNEYGRFNRFVFLDAQDWMDASAIEELWNLIAEKSEPGARVIFRTAGKRSPIEDALPEALLQKFDYLKKESETLFEEDRASIYGGFHLYVLK